MIFDFLSPTQGQQFDPSVYFYLRFVLLIIPVNVICHMTMFEKKNQPLGTPGAPKSHPWGMTKASETKILFDIFHTFYLVSFGLFLDAFPPKPKMPFTYVCKCL